MWGQDGSGSMRREGGQRPRGRPVWPWPHVAGRCALQGPAKAAPVTRASPAPGPAEALRNACTGDRVSEVQGLEHTVTLLSAGLAAHTASWSPWGRRGAVTGRGEAGTPARRPWWNSGHTNSEPERGRSWAEFGMGGTWEDACAAWWIVAPTDQGRGPRVGGSRTAEERGEAVGGLRGAEARASWHQREAADRTGPGQGGCGGRGQDFYGDFNNVGMAN